MESTDLSTDELHSELRRQRALRDLCEEVGEMDGATACWSLCRAIEVKLKVVGESFPPDRY